MKRVVLATVLAAGTILSTNAMADDAITPEARSAVESMSKALSAETFSFHAHTIRQFEANGAPLHIFHDADIVVRRPDHLAIDMAGDDGTSRIVYDGKTLTFFMKDSNKYAEVPVTGSIEAMLREASNRLGVDFPLADLVADQPGQSFLDGVIAGLPVGKVSIDGEPGHHFLYLQPPGLELELWTEDDSSLPRRIVVTYRSIPGEPQFVSEMDNWEVGGNPTDQNFATMVPNDATKIEPPKEPAQ